MLIGGACQCGLCMSVCPTRSIQVEGLNYDEFVALPESEIDYVTLEGMLSSRRSIRSFKDKSVEREVLDQVIRVSAMSPCLEKSCRRQAVSRIDQSRLALGEGLLRQRR